MTEKYRPPSDSTVARKKVYKNRVLEIGVPKLCRGNLDTYKNGPERYIEVQIWDDKVISKILVKFRETFT